MFSIDDMFMFISGNCTAYAFTSYESGYPEATFIFVVLALTFWGIGQYIK